MTPYWMVREMGSPRQARNRRRRTRKGPEPACVQTPWRWVREGRIHVLPWCRLVGVAKTSSETQGGRTGLPARVSGRHVVRVTDRPHLSLPNSQSCFGDSEECAQATGKVVETGQNKGEMGGSSPWTRPSAPECGDTLKALASFGSILGGDQGNLAPGSLSTGSPTGRTLLLKKRRDGSTYSQAHVRAGKSCGSLSERSCP